MDYPTRAKWYRMGQRHEKTVNNLEESCKLGQELRGDLEVTSCFLCWTDKNGMQQCKTVSMDTTEKKATRKKEANDEALLIISQVKDRLGRCYKSAIRNAWCTGNYRDEGLQDLSSELQNIRNSFGPSWLVNARV